MMNDARFDHDSLRVAGALAVAVATALAAAGCGGGESSASGAKAPQGARAEALTHEDCAGGKVEALDTNGDGKPDIERHLDGAGHEQCRVTDLNHDGKPDLYEYFDASGTIRRREYCYDETGLVNAVEYYEGGKLTRREYDISGQHRIDTWDWFDPNAPVDAKTGRPAHPLRRERDTKGDGFVDQWWTWNGDELSIAVDKNGDGKPDTDSTVVFGGDGGGPPAPGQASSTSGAAPASDAGAQGTSVSGDAGGNR
jgi:hypothetical protein